MQPQPIQKDLVLIGGGHSHAIVLKQFGMKPIPGVRLTLITDVSHTPYSGMLPGYIAGAYRFDECHIDLRPLCEFAQGQMIVDRATGLDLQNNRALLADRPPIAFDFVSIDIGSTPAAVTVPGAAEFAIPVKPISQFLQRWDQVIDRLTKQFDSPMRIAVVGGGAGGVELMLGLQARLRQIQQNSGQKDSEQQIELHLFHKGDRLIPERHPRLGHQLERVMRDRGIHLHLNETVCKISTPDTQSPPLVGDLGGFQDLGGVQDLENNPKPSNSNSSTPKEIHCESGLTLPIDEIFWVTQASAAPWLAEAGLQTDDRGFLLVDERLRSISHPQVFAAGDVASMVNYPRPKAGVFAVRQGKPLANNLRRVLQGEDPQPFKPQKEFLILVGTGDFPEGGKSQRSAIASRGTLSFGPHPIFWKWKDSIDRKFMEKFSDLKPMMAMNTKPSPTLDSPPLMHCAGCGSKVGSSVLQRALSRIDSSRIADRSDILIGLDTPDDAAVVSVPSGQVMVQTVDYFRSLLSDPFIFGQIAANHALSDLFAMGAMPQSALAIVTLPYGSPAKQEETLYQVLSGAMQILSQANAALVGGHTIEGAELAFGLSCNGLATADQLWKKGGMQPGQALILTKPLGTGTLFAANMQLRAKGRWIEGAIDSMRLSNQFAIEPLRQSGTTACTDITGFGLLGHLMEMVNASQVAIELDLNALPILEGAKETVQQGFLSSLHPQNLSASRFVQNPPVDHLLYPLLFDPQTSGGLLASVPSDRAIDCLNALRKAGYTDSRIIGKVIAASPENPAPIRMTSTDSVA